MTGEMRVIPSGYTLQRRSEHKTNFWDKIFGRKTPEWKDVLVATDKDHIEGVLYNWGETATWES